MKQHIRVYIGDTKDRFSDIPKTEIEVIRFPEFRILATDIPKYLVEKFTKKRPEVFDMSMDAFEYSAMEQGIALLTANEIAVRTVQYLVATNQCTAEVLQYISGNWVSSPINEKGLLTSPIITSSIFSLNAQLMSSILTGERIEFN